MKKWWRYSKDQRTFILQLTVYGLEDETETHEWRLRVGDAVDIYTKDGDNFISIETRIP